MVAVADTGPLIHFDEIDSIELLTTIDELLVPKTVLDELEAGGVPAELSVVVHEVVEADGEVELQELDEGERAALEIAANRDAILLTDDLEARETADELGVEVHGSIGVITLAYSQSRLSKSEAADLMQVLQDETSLFVTDAVVQRGIELLEQKE